MQSLAELRIRIGTVEIAVVGTSREDCLRQIEAACREVDRQEEARYLLTPKGRVMARVLRKQEAGRMERCDHCKQPAASGTCYRGQWWCDRCLDAAERQEEAAHQAAKDRDQAPHRWPTHRRGLQGPADV